MGSGETGRGGQEIPARRRREGGALVSYQSPEVTGEQT